MKYTYLELETISQPGQFSQYDIEVLVKEIEQLPINAIYVEIGVYKGKSLSIAELMGKEKNLKVYGVDIAKEPELETYLLANPQVTFFWADSNFASEHWIFVSLNLINLLFIDGDHTYEGCKRDIEAWLPYLEPKGTILLHDCDETSPGVVKAVTEFMASHPTASLTLFKTAEKNTSMARIQL